MTAPDGTPEAQADRTEFHIWVEDLTTGDRAAKATIFNGRTIQ